MDTIGAFPLPDDLAAQAAGDAQFYRDALHELIELGVGVARRVAADVGEPVAETAKAFELVSRAVRRTVRLAQFVMAPVKARSDHAPGPAAVRKPGRDGGGGTFYLGDLTDEVLDRLDTPEMLERLDAGQTMDECIEQVCDELGLRGSDRPERRSESEVAERKAQDAVVRARIAADRAAGLAFNGWGGARDTPPPGPLPQGEGGSG